MSNKSIPLLVFAKTPIPGTVKTRLMPHCQPEQAAEIAKILLQATLNIVSSAWPGKVLLATWPRIDDPFLQRLARSFAIDLVCQEQGDLGMKMQAAMQRFGYPAAIIGADAPFVSKPCLTAAHQALTSGHSVIGPSRDGGYYFIGLARPKPCLFENKPWGNDTVLALTVAEFTASERLVTLDQSNDVDTWEDVLRARQPLPQLNHYLSQQGLC